ncbi:hypothetical protein ACM66B_006133 [Microbotryomycetes sp. NB124-2]
MQEQAEPPFLLKMRQFGYPPGWIAGKDPIEAVRDLVGRELDLASIPILLVYGLSTATQDALPPSPPRQDDDGLDRGKHRVNPVAPLPASPPPPLPSAPPPLQRWARYDTGLFDWRTLPAYSSQALPELDPGSVSQRMTNSTDAEPADDEDMDMSDDE